MNRGVYVERLSEVTVGSLTEAFQAWLLLKLNPSPAQRDVESAARYCGEVCNSGK